MTMTADPTTLETASFDAGGEGDRALRIRCDRGLLSRPADYGWVARPACGLTDSCLDETADAGIGVSHA